MAITPPTKTLIGARPVVACGPSSNILIPWRQRVYEPRCRSKTIRVVEPCDKLGVRGTGCMHIGSGEMGMAPVEQSATPLERTRVFIVDDHPIVRQGLAQMLKQEVDLTVCGEAEDV